MSRLSTCLAAASLAVMFAVAPHASLGQGEEMQPPKPGPNHALLQRLVGKWKSQITMRMEPGKPPVVSEGIAEFSSVSGGLWVYGTYNMTGPMATEGHSFEGYDEAKHKFVGVWIDSWGTSLSPYEGSYDATGKNYTGTIASMGPKGETLTSSTTAEWKDANTYIWKMYMTPEPKGDPLMEIVYTRM